MPSTAFGPLVEPAATYPGAAQPPDLGQRFLSGFYMMSEVNRRKQQLENQMAAMALRQQQNDINNSIREADLRRKLDQNEALNAYRDREQNTKDMIFNWKVAKDQEGMDDIAGAAQGLSSISLDPADPNRPAAIWKVIENNSRAAKLAPGMFKSAFDTYNTASRTVRSRFDHDYNDFLKDVKNNIGVGQSTDLNLLWNINQWQEKWVDKEGRDLPHQPSEQYPAPPGAHKTEDLYAKIPTIGAGGVPGEVYVTRPATKIMALRNRMLELDKRATNMPSQVNNEYATPQTVNDVKPATMRDRAMSIQSDPGATSAAKAAAEKWLKDNPQ
jgi:hypothetical protein